MSRELTGDGRTVIGLDLSSAELRLAAERGPGPWIRGDGLRLPFKDGSLDAVTSSIGLVVITPLSALMAEITRVLRLLRNKREMLPPKKHGNIPL